MSENDVDDFLETGKVPDLIKSVPEIKALVSLIKCQICYELMSSPVMSTTGCSHNFCSVCVRTHLTVQQNCPSCFIEMHETQIKPNKILQEIITQFRLLLPKLAEIVSSGKKTVLSQTVGVSRHVQPQSFTQRASTPSRPSTSKPDLTREVPETSTTTTSSSQSTSRQEDESEDSSNPPKGLVSCPVCGINIPNGIINRHLDECLSEGALQTRKEPEAKPVRLTGSANLKLETSSSGAAPKATVFPPKKVNQMKPVTKVVYNLMKDTQLRATLKKEGLETKGDKKTMIARHKKFSILWNAECEKDSPMSRAEILRAVKREEQNLSSLVLTQSTSGSGSSATPSPSVQSLLSFDRKTDPKIIDSKRKEILTKNGNSFSKLIDDIKRRKLEASKSDEPKTSISVVNDGDLEVIPEDESDGTVVAESSPNKENNRNSSQTSDDDDFLTQTPQRHFVSNKSNSTKASTSNHTHFFKTPPSSKKPASASPLSNGLVKQGELYITPKRKTSRELLFDEPKRLRQQVLDSSDPSGSHKRSENVSKAECPVCHDQVPIKQMSRHVDMCLDPKNKIDTRRSNRRGGLQRKEEEEFADDPDSDFEDPDYLVCTPLIEGLVNNSSPELNRSPLLTSTVKKSKQKKK